MIIVRFVARSGSGSYIASKQARQAARFEGLGCLAVKFSMSRILNRPELCVNPLSLGLEVPC